MMETTLNPIVDKRHSRLGIASTVIAIAVPILFIGPIIVAGIIDTPSSSASKPIFGIGFVVGAFAPLMHLIGIVLGVVGWASKKTTNLFPVIGTILNTILLIVGISMIVYILTHLSFGFH